MRSRVLLFSVLALFLVGMVAGGAVSARPKEGFTVTPQEPVEKAYDAMGPGCQGCSGRTGALATLPTTGQCGGNYVWCDAIPVEIVPPTGLQDDRDIFFTIFELHWDDSAGNDLDLQFYDNAQSTGSHEELGSSESTRNPETIRAANADLGEYNLVVINYAGANTGYTIKARITTDPFSSPTESLAPDPPKNEEEAEEEDFTPPEDLSVEPTPTEPDDPTLAPVATGGEGDDDFDFGFSDLENRITINADDLVGSGQEQALPPVRETVSPAVLLASLVGAPALIVGSGAAFAWKRRRTLLL